MAIWAYINNTVLETPHVIVGATIATKVVNPLLSLPLAFASHFILDEVPHWNPHLYSETEKLGKPTPKSTKIVILDVATSLISGFYLALRVLPNRNHAIIILLACFIAVLPDLIEAPYFFLDTRSKLIKRWLLFQKSFQVNSNIIPGLLTQVIVVATSLWWILS